MIAEPAARTEGASAAFVGAGSSARPTAIEIFCGAGGTSFGFGAAGFDVRLGVDINGSALKSFRMNHPSAKTLLASVEDHEATNGAELLRVAGLGSVDVLIGGPSCQGYSTIGKRIEEDSRNRLFIEYIRIVRELRPRWLLFENVRGMLLYGKGRFIRGLQEELEALGYSVTWGVLNAADFGVPQRRLRLLLVGTRDGVTPSLPLPTHGDPRCVECSRPDASNRIRAAERRAPGEASVCSACGGTGRQPLKDGLRPWVSIGEAIGDLPELGDVGGRAGIVPYATEARTDYQRLMRAGSTGFDVHLAKPVSEFAYSIIRHVREGEGIRSIPAEDLPERFQKMRTVSNGSLRRDCTTLYHRLSRDLPSYTITCHFSNVSSGAFVHPTANRAITAREAARLQSFPDRFRFEQKEIRRQIGNAVPPLLAEVLARHMRGLMVGNAAVSGGSTAAARKESERQTALWAK